MPEGAPGPVFEAVRTAAAPDIDGRLDDAAWRDAPGYSAFHQSVPRPGVPPSERTEVRVLYDDDAVYVGVRCFDRRPDTVNARLGRRDDMPASDVVTVMIDSLRDGRTGRSFAVNAAGTLADARLFADTRQDLGWNGEWAGAAARDALGWSAELRIPLELLRFHEAPEQRWGFHVRRELARTHEQLDSVPLPREVNALVSRFTELRGLRNLDPARYVTFTPYVATLLTRRPFPDPEGPRWFEPSADVGLDARLGLASDLLLWVTLSPSFYEVEPDELFVNFTNAELALPEKRPFFLEEQERFEPVVEPESGLPPQRVFYSRRVGLLPGVPVLGAVQLGGHLGDVELGLMDAVVAGAPRSGPNRGARLHAWRPLHLGLNASLPERVPPPTHFFAGSARLPVGEGDTVGTMAALATPLQSACALGETRPEDEDCEAPGGQAGSVDVSLRDEAGDYALAAQLTGSRVTGGPAGGLRLPDGTRLRDGATGLGAQLTGGKLGGEPWRLRLSYGFASPRLELNRTGFQPWNNEQELLVSTEYVRTDWAGLAEASLGLRGSRRWSTDAQLQPLGTSLELTTFAELPDGSSGGCSVGVALGRRDLREVWREGVTFERPSQGFVTCDASSDPLRALSLSVGGTLERLLGVATSNWLTGQMAFLDVTWRPQSRLETTVGATYENLAEGPRWVEELDDDLHLFGDLKPRYLTLTLRQLVVLTPTLTLQGYAQVLSGYERYDRFYEAEAGRGTLLRVEDLTPTEGVESELDPTNQSADLIVNAVARWEYQPGSTLFAVYSREQSTFVFRDEAAFRPTLLPRGLLGGAHTDTFLLKLRHTF